MDIKRVIKEYYKQLYAHKFDNLNNKIDQFLERHNLPKLTQERDHLKKPTNCGNGGRLSLS